MMYGADEEVITIEVTPKEPLKHIDVDIAVTPDGVKDKEITVSNQQLEDEEDEWNF
jgi:hypothetical protein